MSWPLVREKKWELLSGISFLVWFVVYFVSKRLSPVLFRSYNKLTKAERSEWNSRVVSDIHAIWATYGAVLIMLTLDQFDWFGQSDYIYLFYPTLTAYLAYDLLVVIAHRNLWDKGTMLHHTVGILGFLVVMKFNIAHFIANIFYITEATTPFVNQRWFFDKTGMKQSPLYVVNGFIMWLGFLVMRVGFAPAIFITLHKDFDRIVGILGAPILYSVTAMMFAMVMTNTYWWFLISRGLLKALRGQFQSSGSSTKTNQTKGDAKNE